MAFLDIRMPGIDGLKLASIVPDVHVVFVTAHDEYAVDAFDQAAVDYLLKPVRTSGSCAASPGCSAASPREASRRHPPTGRP
nr:response regulator [Burkholderia ubonensis]